MKAITWSLGLGLVAICAVSCATSQSRYTMLGQSYPPKPESYEIQVFAGTEPNRPFARIARLDVHLEKAYFQNSSLDDVLPELKKQARLCGADAVIDVQQRSSEVYETMVFHVTATGIRYTTAP